MGIVINIFFTDTRNALMGTAIFLLGVPVYFYWRRRQVSPHKPGA
jgi:hypothetical protein